MSIEAHDLGDTYNSTMSELSAAINDGRREWSAALLRMCPERGAMRDIARATREKLNSWAVEVNVIHRGEQITIAVSPGEAGSCIKMEDSLCVLAVGANRPLVASDVQGDEFTSRIAERVRHLGSWVSCPIRIAEAAAGSICALQATAREWTPEEEQALFDASEEITKIVDEWLDAQP